MPNPFYGIDWTKDEAFVQLDAAAERFWNRLRPHVDDYGRIYADPQLLKSDLFPRLTDIRITDIARWIAACENARVLRCYFAADGRKYLEVPKFKQRKNWMKATHPPPPQEEQPLLEAVVEKTFSATRSRSRSRSRSRGEGHSAIAIAAPVERPGCAAPSPFKEEKKPELQGKTAPAGPDAQRRPMPPQKPREMWQLLNDEEALSKRITAEVQRPTPDIDLINVLKKSRATLRAEMKATP